MHSGYYGHMTMRTPIYVEQTSSGPREMTPYTRLFEDRIIFISDVLSLDVANEVIAQLLALTALDPTRSITLYVSSPSGSLTAAAAVIDTMEAVAPSIRTVGIGSVGTPGALVIASGDKGMRSVLKNTRFTLSQPYMADDFDKATEIEIQAQEMTDIRDWMEGVLADCTGRDVSVIHSEFENTVMMNAKDALSYGLIDGIAGKVGDGRKQDTSAV